MSNKLVNWVVVILVSTLCGFGGNLLAKHLFPTPAPTQNDRITSFYEDENAAVVSPSTMEKMIDAKDQSYILVDLRSKAEYDAEHIVTAINIPAVSLSVGQIVAEFAKLPKDKQIIVHCYSGYCMLGRQTGKILAEHGVYVKELDAGWSEWRYHWDLINPGEDPSGYKKYMVEGNTPPSSASGNLLMTPCKSGVVGC